MPDPNRNQQRHPREEELGQQFYGIAKVFAERTLHGACRGKFWEVKGLDLDAVERGGDVEPRTLFNLCIGFSPDDRSFDVIQSFPGVETCVAFTVNALGDVISFRDRLPGLEEDSVVVDASVPFKVHDCSPGDEVEHAKRYVHNVARTLARCGMRERGDDSGRSRAR